MARPSKPGTRDGEIKQGWIWIADDNKWRRFSGSSSRDDDDDDEERVERVEKKEPEIIRLNEPEKTFTQKFVEHPIGKVLSSTKTTAVLGAILVGLTGYGVATGALGTKGGILGSAAYQIQITPASVIGKVLVGTGALVKAGGLVFAGLAAISTTSGIMTWLASDNILQAMNIFTRDLREAVTWGHISVAEAEMELDKAQVFIDEAKLFIDINTIANPGLWLFRDIILTNVKAAQNSVDYNKKIISTISPVVQSEDEDWNAIQDANRQRELTERTEDENYFQRIREQNLEDDREQRLEEESYWARIAMENAARKMAERAADEAYWANIRQENADRDAAIRAADEAYWAGIRGEDITPTEETPTTPGTQPTSGITPQQTFERDLALETSQNIAEQESISEAETAAEQREIERGEIV